MGSSNNSSSHSRGCPKHGNIKMASVQASAHPFNLIKWSFALQSLALTCVVATVNTNTNSSIQSGQYASSQLYILTTIIPKHLAKPEQATDNVQDLDHTSEVVGVSDRDRKPYNSELHSDASDTSRSSQSLQMSRGLGMLDPSSKRNISSFSPSLGSSSSSSGGSSGHEQQPELKVLPSRYRGARAGTSMYGDRKYSVLGTMLLMLITMVVSISLIAMLIFFIFKWRDNITNGPRYPSVSYSMLRQGEDEPEDVMGEILLSIGLATHEEVNGTSESEEGESNHDDQEVDMCNLDGSNFTTIPLQSGEETERTHLLAPPRNQEESDEELLQ